MARRCRKRHVQVEIEFPQRGGRRRGAGRKRTGRKRVSHVRRPELDPRHPLHITLRVLDEVGRIRRRDAFKIVRGVMIEHLGREDARIIDLSIQGNHIHIVCEANNRVALSSEMHDFKIAVARRINRIRHRKGPVFADRYHEEILKTPTQTRHCLASSPPRLRTQQLASPRRGQAVESHLRPVLDRHVVHRLARGERRRCPGRHRVVTAT